MAMPRMEWSRKGYFIVCNLPTQRKRRWYLLPQTRRVEKSIVCRASSGIGCSNNKGRSQVLHPDLTKMEKASSAGPLLALDVPTTKDGPGHFVLIRPKREKNIVCRASSGNGCSNNNQNGKKCCPQGLF
jgi:hypothetical protein